MHLTYLLCPPLPLSLIHYFQSLNSHIVIVIDSTHWLMHLTYAGKMVEACQKGSEQERGCDCRWVTPFF